MLTLLQPSVRGQLIKDEWRGVCGGRRVSLQIILRMKQPSAVSAFYVWAVSLLPLHAHSHTHTHIYMASKLLSQLCVVLMGGVESRALLLSTNTADQLTGFKTYATVISKRQTCHTTFWRWPLTLSETVGLISFYMLQLGRVSIRL